MNVQSDEGDPRRTPALNRLLQDLRPDVLALQEVCYPQRRDQLGELLRGTGLEHTTQQSDVIDPPPAGWEPYGGTALATRYPHRVVDVAEHEPDATLPFHWWTLTAHMRIRGAGEQRLILPTTPWEPDAAAAREAQCRDILERNATGLPSIVLGDLNAEPDSTAIRILVGQGFQDVWEIAGNGSGHTWSAGNPLAAAQMKRVLHQAPRSRRIDFILVSPPARIRSARLVAAEPVDGVWLSDHAGVYADLVL